MLKLDMDMGGDEEAEVLTSLMSNVRDPHAQPGKRTREREREREMQFLNF